MAELRPATPADLEAAAAVLHEAFSQAYGAVQVATALMQLDCCRGFMRRALETEAAHCSCVVAELEGRVVGVNVLWAHDPPVGGVGPVAVLPEAQGRRLGRRLMHWALDEAAARGVTSARLVVSASLPRNFALYASLGFRAYGQVAVLCGRAEVPEELAAGVAVRALERGDLAACDALHRRVMGGESRAVETEAALAWPGNRPLVAFDADGGELVGYTAGFVGDGHAVALSRAALLAMLRAHCAADGAKEPRLHVPAQQRAGLLRWALEAGMRVRQQWTMMAAPEVPGWECFSSDELQFSPSDMF